MGQAGPRAAACAPGSQGPTEAEARGGRGLWKGLGAPVRVGGEGLHGPGGGQQLMSIAGNPEEATPRSCPDGRSKPGSNTAGGVG